MEKLIKPRRLDTLASLNGLFLRLELTQPNCFDSSSSDFYFCSVKDLDKKSKDCSPYLINFPDTSVFLPSVEIPRHVGQCVFDVSLNGLDIVYDLRIGRNVSEETENIWFVFTFHFLRCSLNASSLHPSYK